MDTKQRAGEHTLTLAYTAALIVLAVLYRLAPYYLLPRGSYHLWNLTPVGALALFAGSRLRQRWALLVPLVVMLLSDLLLIPALHGRSFSWGTPLLYASFTAYVLIGRLIGSSERSPMVIGGGALLGGLQFFLVSNFLVWPALYPRTAEGLLQCYAAAVPFYRGTVAGDLIFSGLIFGAHAVLLVALRRQKASQPA